MIYLLCLLAVAAIMAVWAYVSLLVLRRVILLPRPWGCVVWATYGVCSLVFCAGIISKIILYPFGL